MIGLRPGADRLAKARRCCPGRSGPVTRRSGAIWSADQVLEGVSDVIRAARHRSRGFASAFAAVVAFVLVDPAVGPVRAAVCGRTDVPTLIVDGKSVPGRVWCVSPPLGARRLHDSTPDVSAIACVSPSLCVVASDETRFAQVVQLDRVRHRIVPIRFVYLADTPVTRNGNDRKAAPELDIEAGAAAGSRVVLAGSHGLSAKGDTLAERHGLFGFDVDEARLEQWPVHRLRGDGERKRGDGVVAFEAAGGAKVGLVRRLLDEVEPADGGVLKAGWGQCLQDNGFNVEGLAFAGTRVLIGLRGPVADGKAFVLAADREAFLAGRVERPGVHALPLDGLSGIRALEPIDTGVLVLTGRSQPEPAKKGPCADFAQGSLTQSALYYWAGPEDSGTLREVARFSEKKQKPEAMTLLGADLAAGEIELLVFFDGQPDGAPVSYRIPFAR